LSCAPIACALKSPVMTGQGQQGQQEPEPAEDPDFDDDELDDEDDIEAGVETHSDCRCAECCRRLIIEVGLEDAERGPKIKEQCSPIYTPGELTKSGNRELEGYLLNKVTNDGHACTFLNETTNLCSIYDTRPWVCRVFDCDGKEREELIQLGILPPRGGRSR
jgi:Fe-S-cluster containining protein